MKINGFHHPILLAGMAFAGAMAPAWAATGTISAFPNPCHIEPGAQTCRTHVTWTSQDARGVRVYVRAEGRKATPEKEFAKEPSCERCDADWIEAGTTYIFTLVDFSEGRRGGVLGNVAVTAAEGPGPRAEGVSGVINAGPNPCHIEPGRADCTTYISWSSTGPHARVYVRSEGAKASGEKEFGTGRAGDRVSATWIGDGTRYIFTLVDFSSGSRGPALASVEVTAVR
jgi:hypothetical protein